MNPTCCPHEAVARVRGLMTVMVSVLGSRFVFMLAPAAQAG